MFWIIYSYVVALIIGVLGWLVWALKKDLQDADEYIESLEEKCDTLDSFYKITMN